MTIIIPKSMKDYKVMYSPHVKDIYIIDEEKMKPGFPLSNPSFLYPSRIDLFEKDMKGDNNENG